MTKKQKIIKIFAIFLAVSIISSILSVIISLFTDISSIFIDTRDLVTYSKEYSNIERIKIDNLNTFITIKEGSKFRVDAINVDKRLKVKLVNNTLKIEEKRIGINNTDSKLIITIPKNIELSDINISDSASKILIMDINVSNFEIEQGIGLLEIKDSYIKNASIDGGIGEIDVTNTTLYNLELDSGIGDIDMTASIMGNSEISCGIGNIDINLIDDKNNYSINIEKGIGSIKVDNKEVENNTIYGNGINKLDIDGGIGSINISFDK